MTDFAPIVKALDVVTKALGIKLPIRIEPEQLILKNIGIMIWQESRRPNALSEREVPHWVAGVWEHEPQSMGVSIGVYAGRTPTEICTNTDTKRFVTTLVLAMMAQRLENAFHDEAMAAEAKMAMTLGDRGEKPAQLLG